MEIDLENKDVEDLSVKVIETRVKLREELVHNREIHRSLAFSKNRFIESELFNENDVHGLCSRIKRRKHATEEDLIKLSTAFYQCEANILSFMRITGAINVVVKEFIGHSNRNILAAQTICNLSLLSDSSKIVTFSGAYLMIYLRNLTHVSLNKICIWTLQNLISSSGHKSIDILMSQELLSNTLYILNNSGDLEIQHEAIQLLDLIIEKKFMSLNMDEKEEVTKSVMNYLFRSNSDGNFVGLQSFYRIVSNNSYELEKEESVRLINLLSENICKLLANPQAIYFSIKILTFIVKSEPFYLAYFLEKLINSNLMLSKIVNEIVKVPKFFNITKGIFYFVGLIFSCELPVAQKYLVFDDLVNNLQIPRMFEF